jgi:hypothetical protein
VLAVVPVPQLPVRALAELPLVKAVQVAVAVGEDQDPETTVLPVPPAVVVAVRVTQVTPAIPATPAQPVTLQLQTAYQ